MSKRNKKMMVFVSSFVFLAIGFCIGWWRSVTAPDAGVAASSARKPGVTSSGAIYSTVPTMSDVDLVKNGTLPEYQNTTVSKAFENTFQDPEWKAVVNVFGH